MSDRAIISEQAIAENCAAAIVFRTAPCNLDLFQVLVRADIKRCGKTGRVLTGMEGCDSATD